MGVAQLARQLEALQEPAPGRWIDNPGAKVLLASCAARAPKAEWQRTTYATTDERVVYLGTRVARLRQIYDAHGKLVCDHETRTGDGEPFRQWAEGPNVDEMVGTVCCHAPHVYRYELDPEYRAALDALTQRKRDEANAIIDLGMARLNAKQRERWAAEAVS